MVYRQQKTITEAEIQSRCTTALERLKKADGFVFDPLDGILYFWDGMLIVEPNDERSVATTAQ